MTIYRTSDWHVGHERIISLSHRPFKNVDHMNHALIENANAVLTASDTLVMHGDNVMGNYERNLELLKQIRVGRLVLMPGNHDRFSIAMRKTETQRKTQRDRIIDVLGDSFDELIVVADKETSAWETKICGHPVLTSHYPYVGDSHGPDRHAHLRAKDEGLPIVHGHVHGEWRENGRQLNVGVDVWNFKPVSDHAIGIWLESLPEAASA